MFQINPCSSFLLGYKDENTFSHCHKCLQLICSELQFKEIRLEIKNMSLIGVYSDFKLLCISYCQTLQSISCFLSSAVTVKTTAMPILLKPPLLCLLIIAYHLKTSFVHPLFCCPFACHLKACDLLERKSVWHGQMVKCGYYEASEDKLPLDHRALLKQKMECC